MEDSEELSNSILKQIEESSKFYKIKNDEVIQINYKDYNEVSFYQNLIYGKSICYIIDKEDFSHHFIINSEEDLLICKNYLEKC